MSIPDGFHTVTPYLLIPNHAVQAVAFYQKAFNAQQLLYMETDDRRVVHAEIKIGNSPVMIGDPTISDDYAPYSGTPHPQIHLLLYVEDVDSFVERAVTAGAKLIAPVEDQISEGDRRGGIEDPFGFVWFVATQIQPVTRDQLQQAEDKRDRDSEYYLKQVV